MGRSAKDGQVRDARVTLRVPVNVRSWLRREARRRGKKTSVSDVALDALRAYKETCSAAETQR
jgi:hypothetical protein